MEVGLFSRDYGTTWVLHNLTIENVCRFGFCGYMLFTMSSLQGDSKSWEYHELLQPSQLGFILAPADDEVREEDADAGNIAVYLQYTVTY